MRFQPKSEDEISSLNLICPGTYDFEIIEAKDTYSKAGNEMIAVKLKVWDMAGQEKFVFDYLLESMAHKLRHLSEQIGLLDKYESGEIFGNDILNKVGKVEIIIQKGSMKQDGTFYPDKNAVKDYPKCVVKQEIKDDFNDALPF